MDAEIAASKPFTLVIGPHRREFIMHSAKVAGLSPALKALVNGPMREGVEGRVEWDFLDDLSFLCFFNYAYTNRYDATKIKADAKPGMSASSNPDLSVTTVLDTKMVVKFDDGQFTSRGWPVRQTSRVKPRKDILSKRAALWTHFCCLKKPRDDPDERNEEAIIAGGELPPEQLVCNAKLYAFADYYGIEDLKVLAYNKLHKDLRDAAECRLRLSNVVSLLQYCCDRPVPDELKELVVLYVACQFDNIWKEEGFQDLLATHGDLSVAIIGELRGLLE
ncbi:uncharacterized protein UV8b_07627 [Ustilaginoidea virens]|uniref:BTB domain-containing protein n=1 Tax=Ustilaginoidea virens TaxID=1159556 RepID=A0A8E5MKS6_USTVR|nr:uncharacterized protein UV8b_07627 [Ustilaginoidea virens]QUC23386.1 hypothetical protein UV8b_07627 [Ustilaginoidea virens]